MSIPMIMEDDTHHYEQHKPTKEASKPQFLPGTTFTEETIAVDQNGLIWWIRPHIGQIYEAKRYRLNWEEPKSKISALKNV